MHVVVDVFGIGTCLEIFYAAKFGASQRPGYKNVLKPLEWTIVIYNLKLFLNRSR
jgi:hypothetical protein